MLSNVNESPIITAVESSERPAAQIPVSGVEMGVDWLEKNMRESLGLPEDAIAWLLMLYGVIQVFDDFADGDKVARSDLDSAIWNALIAMPQNSFYKQHDLVLAPVMASALLRWKASDLAEKSGNASALAFAWRASYYDVVLIVYQLVYGAASAMENSALILNLYGEKFADYLSEFK